MKILDFIKQNNLTTFNLGDGDLEVMGAYAGDFLSNAMSNITQNYVWLTVMNNVNVAAVAHLSESAAVLLCENTLPDAELLKAAKTKKINVLGTKLDLFNASRVLKL